MTELKLIDISDNNNMGEITAFLIVSKIDVIKKDILDKNWDVY